MNISNVIKGMPEYIKKPLRLIYNKWSMKLEGKTIGDLMEYFSLDRKRAMHLLKSSGKLSADLWYCLNPKTKDEITKFYEDNPFYAFDLIFWHGTRYQINLRNKFIGLAKGKVLDYGGGVGDMCMMAKDKKLDVDYADLPGKTFNFAKWLFDKKGYNIPMIDLSGDKISKNYDTIFCIDVIEHVANPKDLLKDFVSRLNNGGYLIITALDPITGEEMPMHFGLDFNPEEYLKSLGMEKKDDNFLWIKK